MTRTGIPEKKLNMNYWSTGLFFNLKNGLRITSLNFSRNLKTDYTDNGSNTRNPYPYRPKKSKDP